ncbi:MAG: tetratricopeptide repeat protein [Gaiellaceae bacterium]
MNLTRISLALAALLFVSAAALLGGAFRETSAASPALLSAQAAEDFSAGFSLNQSTGALVQQLQSALRADPQDARSATLLGLAYQQRARETGDPGYYTRSEGLLRRAISLEPEDALALSGLGALALARHEFGEALELGRRAVALAPGSARHYGVVGDALVELGRYREAFDAFDTMSRLRPSLSSYARTSYARELIGDTPGTIRAMQLAVDAATSAAEPTAWTRVQLGKLYWNHGRLRAAEREYRIALAVVPGYPYALDALALVEAARGRYGRAIALERRAAEAVPIPQYVGTLGDLYAVTGRTAAAREQYALVGAIEQLLNANGVRTDLELALFDLDHGIRPSRALARARASLAERPSIAGEDVLAWALERNGRCREALPHSRRALRLGTQDALMFFHRGMIERCLGQDAQARTWFRRALSLNPHFSLLWAPVARQALA